MKVKKKILSFLAMTMIVTLGIVQNVSYATKAQDPLGLKLSYKRYTTSEGWGYALNNGTAHPIYQILAVNGENIVGTNYFCLDADTSETWNYSREEVTDSNGVKHYYDKAGSISTLASYDEYYDLTNISDLQALVALDKYKQYEAVSKYYKQIMWLLDNIYVASEDKNETIQKNQTNTEQIAYAKKPEQVTKEIEALMAKAGIVYGDTGSTVGSGDYPKIYAYYGDDENNAYYANYMSNTLYANTYANGGYIYQKSGERYTLMLSAEQIEAVEQAAIWYFTNFLPNVSDATINAAKANAKDSNGTFHGRLVANNINTESLDNKYNMYTKWGLTGESGEGLTNRFGDAGWLKYTSGTDTNSYNWPLLNSITTNNDNEGKMLQEQASILYNYLIDAANEYAYSSDAGYQANSNPISVASLKVDTKTVGANSIYGKFKIIKSSSNATPYTLDDGIQILGADGKEISGAKIVDSNGTEINKKAEEMIGTEFYVAVPSGTSISSITVKVTGKYDTTEKLLWLSSTKTEQPIVEIKKTPKPIEETAKIEEDTVFDLALRKAIIGVTAKDGKDKTVVNEDGNSAVRNITYDVSSLTSGTTATYKHRKDPVVIEEGDIVKYSLTIYNEGSRKGYASEIVDQLPQGLALKGYTKNGVTEGTYTSSDGKVKYSYKYDPDTNKITFTNQTKNVLDTYKNGNTIEEEKIEIECEVTKKASNTGYTYLTNIAYISKAYDADLQKEIVTEKKADRDSEPGTYPEKSKSDLVTSSDAKKGYKGYIGGTNYSVYDDTKNSMYFAGEQDDDDFEVVVMLPKEFDLKLVKYITAVNGDTSKGRTVTKIDTSDLASRKDTTAKYTLSKDPVKVKYGDYVTYTFRVYNEGDLDGYVTRLTDNIPLGLQFVQAKGDGKTVTIYSYDAKNGLTSKDEEVDEKTYKIVDENNAYWKLDRSTTIAVPADESQVPTDGLKVDTYDGDTTPSISINVKDYLGGTNKLLKAYDSSVDTNKDGSTLSYVDVTAVLRVSESAELSKIIRNEAAITGDSDSEGKDVTDRDSEPENWPGKDDHTKYQDDEDYDNVILQAYDISLRKFIAAVSKDVNLKDVEYLTTDSKAKTDSNEYTRAAKLDTTKLKAGTATTAIYKHTKDPVTVAVNNYVLYDIRVYNEGDIDAYASKITDHLPTYLDYVDCKFNQDFGWVVAKDGKTVSTNYLSSEKETDTNKTVLKAFDSVNDDGKGSGVSFRDVQILARVNDKARTNQNITNIAQVSEYQGEDGKVVEKDRDSKPDNLSDEVLNQENRPNYEGGEDTDKTDGYIPGQEDDDDFERVIVKKFDLALRKQIVNIHNAHTNEDTKYDNRFAKLDNKQKDTIYDYYDVESNIPQVVANDVVTYSIRVYNEGETDGTATWVTDRMPSGLEYLKDNETNKKYGWKAYKEVSETEEGAIKIGEKYYKEVDFSSNDITFYATEYLKNATIKAYTGESEADYKEVYMVARVKDKKEVTDKAYTLRNTAEIGDDNGDDSDSTPGNDNKWKEEDDLDIEDLKLVEFDLSLLKYVSTVYVTEDGKTTTTQTNNVGNDETDIIPKVEIHRKKVNKTVVKFGYTIKITNEGDIAGYVKEITDYVPTGLKFYAEDNQGWTDEGNNVISTRLLENTLLQPGESAQVTVILRWMNGNDNLGVKINTAEISEDYNDKHVPDRDSTPDNKVPGEDDIDDAPVLLSISTGLGENVMMYVGGAIVILAVLGSGIVLIKKFVL